MASLRQHAHGSARGMPARSACAGAGASPAARNSAATAGFLADAQLDHQMAVRLRAGRPPVPQWRDRQRARRRRRRARARGSCRTSGGKRRDVAARDVGRIATRPDRSAAPAPRRNRRPQIARAARSPSCAALSRAADQRVGADVGADAGGVRQFGQQREQQRARAGAEIGDAQRAAARPACVDRGERRLDHGLGLRPRHQRRVGDAQRQPPEFLAADDARHRLALEPPRRKRGQRRAPRRRRDCGSPRSPARCGRGRAHGRSAGARRARANRGRRWRNASVSARRACAMVMPVRAATAAALARQCPSGAFGRQQLGLMLGHQRVDDLAAAPRPPSPWADCRASD